MRWLLVLLVACRHPAPVAEPIAPLEAIAIRPSAAGLPLLSVLPERVEVEVEVTAPTEFAQFMTWLRAGDVPNRGRVHPRVVARAGTHHRRASVQLDARTYAASSEREQHRLERAGYRVVRVPAPYADALFDRESDGTRVVYLPTLGGPDDAVARATYEGEGLVVRPVGALDDVVD